MTFDDLDDLIPSDLVEKHDPVLRQIRPTSESVKPSRSWWEDVPVGSMTRTADQQRQRMNATREYMQVSGSIGV